MQRLLHLMPLVIFILSEALCVLTANPAHSSSITLDTNTPTSSPLLSPVRAVPGRVEPIIGNTSLVPNLRLVQAMKRGQWSAACAIATKILAQQQRDVDALGVYALCAAFRNDRESANAALSRLNEAESVPRYYAQLTQGVLHLEDNFPDKASAVFHAVVQWRAGDPLALYFEGEALAAQGRNTESASALKSTLAIWPDHAPALSAIARLISSENSSKRAVQSAIVMVERAANIEPTNQTYWQQLADLCDHAGEHGRANAIRLQWLGQRGRR